MQGHQAEKEPKRTVILGRRGFETKGRAAEFDKSQTRYGEAANEVAEGHEFFCGKIPVRELVAEKHADDGRYGKGAQDQLLLALG